VKCYKVVRIAGTV